MSLRGQHSGSKPKLLADTSRFLIVGVSGIPMALHADSVQGLLTIEETGSDRSPVVHGQTYLAIQLCDRIGLSPDQDGAETRVVLLSSGSARGSLRVAKVYGLEEVGRSRLLSLPPQFRSEEREWYRGILLLEEGVALILDLAWLIGANRSAHVNMGHEGRDESSRLLDVRPDFATGRAA